MGSISIAPENLMRSETVCMCVHIYVCTYIYSYLLCLYICISGMFVHIYIYMYIHVETICIHTHTHTQLQAKLTSHTHVCRIPHPLSHATHINICKFALKNGAGDNPKLHACKWFKICDMPHTQNGQHMCDMWHHLSSWTCNIQMCDMFHLFFRTCNIQSDVWYVSFIFLKLQHSDVWYVSFICLWHVTSYICDIYMW